MQACFEWTLNASFFYFLNFTVKIKFQYLAILKNDTKKSKYCFAGKSL